MPNAVETTEIRFREGAHDQYVAMGPHKTTSTPTDAKPFDLVLSDYGDFVGRISISGGGTRNLQKVGVGDEAAFLQLIQAKDWWLAGQRLMDAARELDIEVDQRAGYWTPNGPDCVVGVILALRDARDSRRAKGLAFVQDIAPGTLTLWVVRAPPASDP